MAATEQLISRQQVLADQGDGARCVCHQHLRLSCLHPRQQQNRGFGEGQRVGYATTRHPHHCVAGLKLRGGRLGVAAVEYLVVVLLGSQ